MIKVLMFVCMTLDPNHIGYDCYVHHKKHQVLTVEGCKRSMKQFEESIKGLGYVVDLTCVKEIRGIPV